MVDLWGLIVYHTVSVDTIKRSRKLQAKIEVKVSLLILSPKWGDNPTYAAGFESVNENIAVE